MRGIRVEAGLRATLFADFDFTGIRKTINGPAQYCSSIPDFPDNSLSSMIVDVLPKVDTEGLWVEAVRSNEGITGGI